MGEGWSYQDMQQKRFQCTDFRKEIAKGSLAIHRQNQHGVERGGEGLKDDEGYGGDEPRTFRMTFP